MDETDRLRSRSALFICLSAGELLRLLTLAILGGSWLPGIPGGRAAQGAWLLLFLAPHAAIATAYLHAARSPRSIAPWLKVALPAKLIGILSAAILFGAEIAAETPTQVRLWLPESSVPEWFLLAFVLAWDLGALAALVVSAIEARATGNGTRSGPGPAPAAPDAEDPAIRHGAENPFYREGDVEVVDEKPAAKPAPKPLR